jgi:chemotaxis protein MotB
MNLRALALPVLAAAALVGTGCGNNRDLSYKNVEAEELQRQVKELEALLAQRSEGQANTAITETVNQGGSKSDATKAGVGDGVAYSERDHQIEVVLTIENSVLFKPGKSELSSQAKATLARVAATIKSQYPDHYVRVEGHTDNQPITRTKNEWKDNWDLSGGRGQAVLHYLIERGIPASELGFAGYADQRPVSSNSSDAGKSKNRRVEIVVIPKGAPAKSEAGKQD